MYLSILEIDLVQVFKGARWKYDGAVADVDFDCFVFCLRECSSGSPEAFVVDEFNLSFECLVVGISVFGFIKALLGHGYFDAVSAEY